MHKNEGYTIKTIKEVIIYISTGLLCCILLYYIYSEPDSFRIAFTKMKKSNFLLKKFINLPKNVPSPSYFDSWYDIVNQIRNKSVSMAFARYGDGEYFTMSGDNFRSVDNFDYHGGNTTLKYQLLESITGQYGKNYYYGVYPEYPKGYFDYLLKIEADINHFSFTNLWINANYVKTKEFLKNIIYEEYQEIILLINDHAKKTQFAKEVIRFSPDLNAIWEKEHKKILGDLKKLAKKYNNKLFMVSVGPFANAMIWTMFNANPNNRYIDFGSALAKFVGVDINRPYYSSKSKYRWQVDPNFYLDDTGEIVLIQPNKTILKEMRNAGL